MSNGQSFNNSSGYADRSLSDQRSTEETWVRWLSPVQPGAVFSAHKPAFALLIVGLTLAVVIALLVLRQHEAAAALARTLSTHYWD